jgi:putative membrane protein insertion efficiency factor
MIVEGNTIPQDIPEHRSPPLRELPLTPKNFPRFVLLVLIRLYQRTLSLTLPPDTCRFYTTCSPYGYPAIFKYGAIKGSWMAIRRIFRCNPFNPGGYDPVP